LDAQLAYEFDCANASYKGLDNFMLSPTVEMDSFSQTKEIADSLAGALGQPEAQILSTSCTYQRLTW
jgi:hypothetical protein